ncbi:MAG TPA: toll/interleukin-1 receptor domain-containing protein [Blastocatellia bacterium]|nr:toll/interleukin-1 receptor domain-containing protein [Blastocatellia bacterium]
MPRARTKRQTSLSSRHRAPLPFQVFISHSSHDAWVAGQIGKEIEALGATIALDKHFLKGGDDINKKIIEEIRKSTEVIVLLSPESQKSQWVPTEVGMALALDKYLTPILYNVLPEEMMRPLQVVKAIDLNDFDSFLIELRQRIKKKERIDRKRR